MVNATQYEAIQGVIARQRRGKRWPNFIAAERELGITRGTIAGVWRRGVRASAKSPALPPLAQVFTATPTREPGPYADLPRKPAPSPLSDPPGGSLGAASDASSPAATPAEALAAPPTFPATLAGRMAAQHAAAIEAELRLISAGRHATAGVVATATNLLGVINKAVPALADELTKLLTTEPLRGASMLETLSRTIESSIRSADKLAGLSRLIDGLPSEIKETRTAEVPPPISDAEIERRVSLVLAAVERGARRAGDSAVGAPVIDVPAVPVADTAAATPTTEGTP